MTTTTTRPASIDDLTDWDRRGEHIATITAGALAKHPSLGMHLLAALAEAERLGLSVKDGEILIPLTEDDLTARLERAQRAWDSNRDDYQLARVGEPVYTWRRPTIDVWAAAEGLDPIDWDEVPAK